MKTIPDADSLELEIAAATLVEMRAGQLDHAVVRSIADRLEIRLRIKYPESIDRLSPGWARRLAVIVILDIASELRKQLFPSPAPPAAPMN